MFRDEQFFTKALPIIKDLMDCFLSFTSDKEKFNAIITSTRQPAVQTQTTIDIRGFFFEKVGFTFGEISSYLTLKNGSTHIQYTQFIFNLLVSKNIISIGNQAINDISTLNPDFALSAGTRYLITNEGVILAIHGLVENTILGHTYIIERYKKSIVQVLGTTADGDQVIGTGFLVKSRTDFKIITCKHNVEHISNLKICSGEITIPHGAIKYAKSIDCVMIDVSFNSNIEPLPMFLYADVLSEIITMGYPKIPRSGDAYLMVHKGEINGMVKNYQQTEEYIIFSAKTSSGNSGSPLINNDGAVVGMVTNEFFDKDAYLEQGKPPYYAAIPSQVIMTEFGLNIVENISDNAYLVKLISTLQSQK